MGLVSMGGPLWGGFQVSGVLEGCEEGTLGTPNEGKEVSWMYIM